MRYYTHLAFSFLIGLFIIKYLSIKNQILFIILIMFFSLLPDIDKVDSKVSNQFKPLAWLVYLSMGHRGLIHSIWFVIIIYLLLFQINMEIAIAASFGYLSHLIADCLTPQGVKLLWPLKKSLRGFIRTGSFMENILFLGLLIADVYFLINF